jgi:hypothetical protein
MPVSRRVFLRMLGLAVASEALAACTACYAPRMPPTPTEPASSEDLRLQAELLAELGERGGLEAETVARARASLERDIAFLTLSDGDK